MTPPPLAPASATPLLDAALEGGLPDVLGGPAPRSDVPLIRSETALDRFTSRRLAQQVGARPKECFANAMRALHALSGAWAYVEGYVVFDELPAPVRHAWLQAGDGRPDAPWRILDPTPLYCQPDERPDLARHRTYIPGPELDVGEFAWLVLCLAEETTTAVEMSGALGRAMRHTGARARHRARAQVQLPFSVHHRTEAIGAADDAARAAAWRLLAPDLPRALTFWSL